jgi:hypothetical protein
MAPALEPIDPKSQDHSVEIRYRDKKARETYGLTSLNGAYEAVAIMEAEPNVERLTIFKVDTTVEPWKRKRVFQKSVPAAPAAKAGRLRPSGLAA